MVFQRGAGQLQHGRTQLGRALGCVRRAVHHRLRQGLPVLQVAALGQLQAHGLARG